MAEFTLLMTFLEEINGKFIYMKIRWNFGCKTYLVRNSSTSPKIRDWPLGMVVWETFGKWLEVIWKRANEYNWNRFTDIFCIDHQMEVSNSNVTISRKIGKIHEMLHNFSFRWNWSERREWNWWQSFDEKGKRRFLEVTSSMDNQVSYQLVIIALWHLVKHTIEGYLGQTNLLSYKSM